MSRTVKKAFVEIFLDGVIKRELVALTNITDFEDENGVMQKMKSHSNPISLLQEDRKINYFDDLGNYKEGGVFQRTIDINSGSSSQSSSRSSQSSLGSQNSQVSSINKGSATPGLVTPAKEITTTAASAAAQAEIEAARAVAVEARIARLIQRGYKREFIEKYDRLYATYEQKYRDQIYFLDDEFPSGTKLIELVEGVLVKENIFTEAKERACSYRNFCTRVLVGVFTPKALLKYTKGGKTWATDDEGKRMYTDCGNLWGAGIRGIKDKAVLLGTTTVANGGRYWFKKDNLTELEIEAADALMNRSMENYLSNKKQAIRDAEQPNPR